MFLFKGGDKRRREAGYLLENGQNKRGKPEANSGDDQGNVNHKSPSLLMGGEKLALEDDQGSVERTLGGYFQEGQQVTRDTGKERNDGDGDAQEGEDRSHDDEGLGSSESPGARARGLGVDKVGVLGVGGRHGMAESGSMGAGGGLILVGGALQHEGEERGAQDTEGSYDA